MLCFKKDLNHDGIRFYMLRPAHGWFRVGVKGWINNTVVNYWAYIVCIERMGVTMPSLSEIITVRQPRTSSLIYVPTLDRLPVLRTTSKPIKN